MKGFVFSGGAFSGKGFVFSLDAAVAAILLLLSISFLSFSINSFGPQNDFTITSLNESSFNAILKSGYLLETLDNNSPTASVSLLKSRLDSFLSASFESRLDLRKMDLNAAACRDEQDFTSCFPPETVISVSEGSDAPENADVYSLKKFFLLHQPPSDCNLNYGAFLEELGETEFNERILFFDSVPEHKTALLDFNEEEFQVDFNISLNPDSNLQCDQGIDITLSIRTPENVRSPVDVMLVIDKSGSMSWTGRIETTNALSLSMSGDYVFLADGSAGLRSMNVSDPALPVYSNLEDDGTIIDVSISGDYAFAADTAGTDELISYNISSPENISADLDKVSLNTFYGLYASGNYVYTASQRTSSSSTRGLNIYSALNPSSMSFSGGVQTSDPEDVFVSGSYAFFADGTAGFKVIDVSNPASPLIADSDDLAAGSSDEAKAVFVSGNYAFVASESDGLHVYDVTNKTSIILLDTYNTPGSAVDVFVSGNYAFVSDSSSIQVIDVSNPSSMALVKSISTPYTFYKLWVEGNYVFLATNIGFMSIDWVQGPKIDNVKASASSFLDFNGWDFNSDQMGLSSFNTSATLNRQLTQSKSDVNSSVYALVSSGGTDIESGIRSATTELTSVRANSNAVKFQVLLSDGQSTEGDSLDAAQDAAAQGITIYTIGFGADASETELMAIAEASDGNYYYASDANVLAEIYALIAKEISEQAADSNVMVPVLGGAVAVDLGGGALQDGNIVFEVGALEPGELWSAQYTLNFPCSSELNCGVEAITFPGAGAQFIFIDADGNMHAYDFNASKTVDFLGRDLRVDIFSGRIYAEGEVYLDVNVFSASDLAADESHLRFYLNDTVPENILATYSTPRLCGAQETDECDSVYSIFSPVILDESGVIYATVNDENEISECPLGNQDAVHCYGAPITQGFIINYFVWGK